MQAALPDLTPMFNLVVVLSLVAVVGRAAFVRGRLFATFVSVMLGLHSLMAVALFPHLGMAQPLVLMLQISAGLHLFMLASPRLRPLWYRALVSIPGSYFVAVSLLSAPWAVAIALGFEPWGLWLPWVVGAWGVVESLRPRKERRAVVLDRADVGPQRRVPCPPAPTAQRPLRIVQITDPHLGPFMSVPQLRAICRRAVDMNPDLILLTGDFLTMESSATPGALAAALEPLRDARGTTYACFGNHDLEAPDEVRQGLAANGVRLLVDDSALADTPAGLVQIVGFNFHWQERGPQMQQVCDAHPRVPGALRLVMLHDPGAFKHLPEGEGDLVLAGHTHGGQVGLVSLGSNLTFLSLFKGLPDHGLWGRGTDRLYVHRGTGHYGYPLRVGVPAEESLIEVYWGWTSP